MGGSVWANRSSNIPQGKPEICSRPQGLGILPLMQGGQLDDVRRVQNDVKAPRDAKCTVLLGHAGPLQALDGRRKHPIQRLMKAQAE